MDAVRKEGAVPLILILPTLEETARRLGIRAGEPPPSSAILRDALGRFCAREGVSCIEALEDLASARVPVNDLFLPGDDHFSPGGHTVVADLLAESLERMLAWHPAPSD